MKTVKFKHRDSQIFENQVGDVVTGTYSGAGGFYVDYMTSSGRAASYSWDAEDADRLFDSGLWVKEPEQEVIQFLCDFDADLFTATFDGEGSCFVSWNDGQVTRSTRYAEHAARRHFATGNWKPIKLTPVEEVRPVPTSWADYVSPEPEQSDFEKARVLIAELNLCVTVEGTGYIVHQLVDYHASDDYALLQICQILEDLQEYA